MNEEKKTIQTQRNRFNLAKIFMRRTIHRDTDLRVSEHYAASQNEGAKKKIKAINYNSKLNRVGSYFFFRRRCFWNSHFDGNLMSKKTHSDRPKLFLKWSNLHSL